MEIIENKQIKDILYKEFTLKGERISVDKNGEIINIQDLITPMRDDHEINLSKREPHMIFYIFFERKPPNL